MADELYLGLPRDVWEYEIIPRLSTVSVPGILSDMNYDIVTVARLRLTCRWTNQLLAHLPLLCQWQSQSKWPWFRCINEINQVIRASVRHPIFASFAYYAPPLQDPIFKGHWYLSGKSACTFFIALPAMEMAKRFIREDKPALYEMMLQAVSPSVLRAKRSSAIATVEFSAIIHDRPWMVSFVDTWTSVDIQLAVQYGAFAFMEALANREELTGRSLTHMFNLVLKHARCMQATHSPDNARHQERARQWIKWVRRRQHAPTEDTVDNVSEM